MQSHGFWSQNISQKIFETPCYKKLTSNNKTMRLLGLKLTRCIRNVANKIKIMKNVLLSLGYKLFEAYAE